MLKKIQSNQSGVVFITVLAIIIVMMIITVSVIGMNVNQTIMTENEVKRIKSDMLGQGAMAYYFMEKFTNPAMTSLSLPQTLDGVPYTVNITEGAAGSGIHGTARLDINITY